MVNHISLTVIMVDYAPEVYLVGFWITAYMPKRDNPLHYRLLAYSHRFLYMIERNTS